MATAEEARLFKEVAIFFFLSVGFCCSCRQAGRRLELGAREEEGWLGGEGGEERERERRKKEK